MASVLSSLRIHKILVFFTIAILIIFISGWLYQCFALIYYPIPLEYRDFAGIGLTREFLTRGHPYSFSDGPPFFHIYGFVFPLLVGWLKSILNIDLLLLTKLTVFCCVCTSAFILAVEVFVLTRLSVYAMLAFTLMLWASWNEHVFFVLRPDALATLISISLLFFLRRRQAYADLFIASLGVVLLFFTKSYFFIIFFTIAFYLIVARDLRYFFIFNFFVGALLISSILLVNYLFPAYFYASVIAQFNAVGGSWSYSFKQLFIFSQQYWPLLLLLLVRPTRQLEVYTSNLHFPFAKKLLFFFSDPKVGIYRCSVLVSVIFLILLGKNTGAFLSYHYQLLIPSLTVISLVSLSSIKSRLFSNLIISTCIIFPIFNGRLNYFVAPYTTTDLSNWLQVKDLIASVSSQKLLLSSPPLAALSPGNQAIVLDDGQSEWYSGLQRHATSPKIFERFYGQAANYWGEFEKYYRKIDEQIKLRDFDLIVVTKGYHPMISQKYLDQYYSKSLEIPIKTGAQTWAVEFWRPQ